MKKTLLCAAACAALVPPAFAQTAAAPVSDHAFTGNVALVSDYRFRGISQTFRRPAVQGGFDYAHSSGFYLGNWNSSLSGVQYPDGAGLEMDFYGGYRFEAAPGLTLDAGALYYYYPGARIAGTSEKFNNTELYIGASYKWFSAKYSYNVSDFFGLNNASAAAPNGDSKGSSYLDLGASFEVADKTTLGLHVGRQWVRNYGDLSYTDYKLGLTRDLGFATLGLALVGTDADRDLYSVTNGRGKTRRLSDTTAVVTLAKSF
ncbi:MAG: TorF family putative porin [Noviherbaspirillum sp.]